MRELECNTALLTMELISGADISMPAFELQEDSFNIQHDINYQKVINCTKLKFIVKRDICLTLPVVS